jgi:ankyrin repeat protein
MSKTAGARTVSLDSRPRTAPHVPRLETITYTLNESKDWNAYAPLHYAAKTGKVDSAKVLIDSHPEINTISNLRRTPLHLAAENNHEGVISELLEAGANINARDH